MSETQMPMWVSRWSGTMRAVLGGCPSNHAGCGERSGGARRQPRCQMAARSSLLRRPTPGARPARRTSSVVAALAALAPRLVRLGHHDYPDGLLGGCPRLVCLARHGDLDSLLADDPAADNPKRGGG